MAKLVRDLIPAIIRAGGGRPTVRSASPAEYAQLLRHKLVEEAGEVLESGDRDGTLDELADVCEVVLALAATLGFSWADIEAARRAKKDRCGGFAAAVVLDEPARGQP